MIKEATTLGELVPAVVRRSEPKYGLGASNWHTSRTDPTFNCFQKLKHTQSTGIYIPSCSLASRKIARILLIPSPSGLVGSA
jgi:hypothetical protein